MNQIRKPRIYKDPYDGMWVCEVQIYNRWEDSDNHPTNEDDCYYYAYGEGHTALQSYQAWCHSLSQRLKGYSS